MWLPAGKTAHKWSINVYRCEYAVTVVDFGVWATAGTTGSPSLKIPVLMKIRYLKISQVELQDTRCLLCCYKLNIHIVYSLKCPHLVKAECLTRICFQTICDFSNRTLLDQIIRENWKFKKFKIKKILHTVEQLAVKSWFISWLDFKLMLKLFSVCNGTMKVVISNCLPIRFAYQDKGSDIYLK